MRLAQRNRLAELDEEIAQARGDQQSRQRDLMALSGILETARQDEKAKRERWRTAQHAITAAQGAVDDAQYAVSELTTRKGALEDARVRLVTSLAEAEAAQLSTKEALEASSEENHAANLLATQEAQLKLARERAELASVKLAGIESTSQMRQNRLTQLSRDQASLGTALRGGAGPVEDAGGAGQ
ncbi:hypothetical protein PSQ19_18375 [Devosia algicola]|uniref:Crescentin coiled-coil domain-containing protein n=1 Tax=Devosia algicola TaxID=3026418 RepID=A0ABY7YMV9_9HYPH|nr:hypothetical protein [Devosia algicola]WDR02527.1 hypothetical protein PSQ19_18375 [Devosia algicola]